MTYVYYMSNICALNARTPLWRHHNHTPNSKWLQCIENSSAYFWKIDCISVNVDQFSSKFWYVLAETIFYKCRCHDFSFWQKHHGVFLRLKEACQFFTFCVYSLWDMTFSKIWILHSCLLRAISRHYFCLDYVDFRVCCSWDYMLSKSPHILPIGFEDHAHDHHHCLNDDDSIFHFAWLISDHFIIIITIISDDQSWSSWLPIRSSWQSWSSSSVPILFLDHIPGLLFWFS